MFITLLALGAGLVLILAVSATAKADPVTTSIPPAAAASSLPVGLRNNNPTNVKGKGWRGQTGADAQGHAIFDSLINGLRAAMIDIHTGFVRDHEDTVDAIVQEWAGAEAPNIENYKRFVWERLGVSRDAPLSFEIHVIPLVKALSEFELGQAAYRKWNPPHSLFADALTATGRV